MLCPWLHQFCLWTSLKGSVHTISKMLLQVALTLILLVLSVVSLETDEHQPRMFRELEEDSNLFVHPGFFAGPVIANIQAHHPYHRCHWINSKNCQVSVGPSGEEDSTNANGNGIRFEETGDSSVRRPYGTRLGVRAGFEAPGRIANTRRPHNLEQVCTSSRVRVWKPSSSESRAPSSTTRK